MLNVWFKLIYRQRVQHFVSHYSFYKCVHYLNFNRLMNNNIKLLLKMSETPDG